MPFTRDESHWLFKLSPDEWIAAAQNELSHAEKGYAARNSRAGLAGVKRAAGMALNGALIVEPNEAWGRSYVDHIIALAKDESVPSAVREACKLIAETPLSGQGSLVTLRTTKTEERILEAARDVIAHAYAVVKRYERQS